MHMDPMIPALVGTAFAVLGIGVLLHRLRLPQVVAYLMAGILIGPDGLGLFADTDSIERFGEAGVVLLLFFLGMEISIPRVVGNWRVAILGTAVQILVSVAAVVAVGTFLHWSMSRAVLLGFVISLSSTAVVIPVLRNRSELDTPVGHDVVGVLLVQDFAVVPMLIVVAWLGGDESAGPSVFRQLAGATGVMLLLWWLARGGSIHLPLARFVRRDHELQVFAAFALCFGMALLTGSLGLTAAIGAFLAGIIVSAAQETEWVHKSLDPLRVILVAFFFVSVGMLLNLGFLRANWGIVLLLVGLAIVTNTVINAVVFRLLRRSWRDSWYGGALLSQIGEFSFVLAAVGFEASMISDFGYQATIAVIVLSLLLSPFWVQTLRAVRQRGA